MDFRAFAILILFCCIGTISSQRLVCPVNSQSFISTSRTLLPIENVRSTSEYRFNPTPNFVNRGDGEPAWCTSPNVTTIVGQYVELNFTEPVVIGLLMSGGFVSSYVNNFTLHYTLSSTENDFETYGSLKPTEDFLVSDLLTSNANFVLGKQIPARRVKFVVNDGMLNQQGVACWKMLVYGCTMNEAQQLREIQQTDEITTAATTSPDLPTTTASGSTASPIMTCPPAPNNQTQNSVLLIILPAIIGITLIVIIVVAILLCVCCVRSNNQKKLEYKPNPTIERASEHHTKESIENGTTTPSSSNFHYDNPRFLCYDVPRTSIRSRQNSESMSTIASLAEIKNPIYAAAKKSLQDYNDSPYHLPPEDSGNDYEDIPDTPTELEKRTFTNTNSNSPRKTAAPLTLSEPKGNGVILDESRSPTVTSPKYSQVHKIRSKEKDEMENESSSPPPVINSHYVSSSSSNNALAQEIDRLVNDLESSRAIARQW